MAGQKRNDDATIVIGRVGLEVDMRCARHGPELLGRPRAIEQVAGLADRGARVRGAGSDEQRCRHAANAIDRRSALESMPSTGDSRATSSVAATGDTAGPSTGPSRKRIRFATAVTISG